MLLGDLEVSTQEGEGRVRLFSDVVYEHIPFKFIVYCYAQIFCAYFGFQSVAMQFISIPLC